MPEINQVPVNSPGVQIPIAMRQKMLADQLLSQQAQTGTPIYSKGVAIAKALAGGLGGMMANTHAAEEDRLQGEAGAALAAAQWARLQGASQVGAAPAAAPGAAPSRHAGAANNQGNLIDNAWTQHLPGYAGASGRFATFDTPEHGMGAMNANLSSYAHQGITTLSELTHHWAPVGDGANNPDAYAARLAHGMGIGVNDPINLADPAFQTRLGPLIAGVEANPAARVPPMPSPSAPANANLPVPGAAKSGADFLPPGITLGMMGRTDSLDPNAPPAAVNPNKYPSRESDNVVDRRGAAPANPSAISGAAAGGDWPYKSNPDVANANMEGINRRMGGAGPAWRVPPDVASPEFIDPNGRNTENGARNFADLSAPPRNNAPQGPLADDFGAMGAINTPEALAASAGQAPQAPQAPTSPALSPADMALLTGALGPTGTLPPPATGPSPQIGMNPSSVPGPPPPPSDAPQGPLAGDFGTMGAPSAPPPAAPPAAPIAQPMDNSAGLGPGAGGTLPSDMNPPPASMASSMAPVSAALGQPVPQDMGALGLGPGAGGPGAPLGPGDMGGAKPVPTPQELKAAAAGLLDYPQFADVPTPASRPVGLGEKAGPEAQTPAARMAAALKNQMPQPGAPGAPAEGDFVNTFAGGIPEPSGAAPSNTGMTPSSVTSPPSGAAPPQVGMGPSSVPEQAVPMPPPRPVAADAPAAGAIPLPIPPPGSATPQALAQALSSPPVGRGGVGQTPTQFNVAEANGFSAPPPAQLPSLGSSASAPPGKASLLASLLGGGGQAPAQAASAGAPSNAQALAGGLTMPQGMDPAVWAAVQNPRIPMAERMALLQPVAPIAVPDGSSLWNPQTHSWMQPPVEPKFVAGRDGQAPFNQAVGAGPNALSPADFEARKSLATSEGNAAGEREKEMNAEGTAAQDNLGRLQLLQGVLSKTQSGVLAPEAGTAVAFAAKFGISPETIASWGFDPNQAVNNQFANKLASELTVGAIGAKNGGFPASNFSVAEREFLQKMFPDIENQPGSNAAVSDVLEAREQRKIDRVTNWNTYQDKAKAAGQFPDYREFETQDRRANAGKNVFQGVIDKYNAGAYTGGTVPTPFGQNAAKSGAPAAPGATPSGTQQPGVRKTNTGVTWSIGGA